MKIFGIALFLVGLTIAVWTTEDLHLGYQISATMLMVGITLLVYGFTRTKKPISRQNIVGDLADVLESLGEQLQEANARKREVGTIALGSAEVELSLTTETGVEGSMTFKVIEGVSKHAVSSTTRLKVMVYPMDEGGYEIGQ